MKSRIRVIWFVSCILYLLIFPVLNQVVHAQGAAQALAAHPVEAVTGMRARVWTAQQANMNNNWVASPLGVCTEPPPCLDGDGFVETGYIKEHGKIAEAPDNVLQQYSTWADGNGNFGKKYDLGNLNDIAWYEFMVLSQAKKGGRWVIKRDNIQVWTWGWAALGFNQGRSVWCGAEAFAAGTNIAVECRDMQFHNQGVWTLFNYSDTITSPNYCVFKPMNFGALGWGPC